MASRPDSESTPDPAWLRAIGAALVGVVVGVVATLAVGGRSERSADAGDSAARARFERGGELGPDDAPIGSLRVSVTTGTVNGAGTQNPVRLWIDNRPYELSEDPAHRYDPGATTTAVLNGAGLPRTLGALRAASVVLTLHLDRAEIGASWYCERALLEVRLEGEQSYAPYLDVRDVGWLSQDEPPRRSPAFALQ